MVFPRLDMSVFDFLRDNLYYPFPLWHVRSIAAQLLRAISCMYHRACLRQPAADPTLTLRRHPAVTRRLEMSSSDMHSMDIVHTDIKPENIMLVDGNYRVVPSKSSVTGDRRDLINATIRLIDFGSAVMGRGLRTNVVSTRHYRAPEIVLGIGWSAPCDLWSIGCVLVELYTGEALFQTHDNVEHLAMMEQVLGRFPERMTHVYVSAGRGREPGRAVRIRLTEASRGNIGRALAQGARRRTALLP